MVVQDIVKTVVEEIKTFVSGVAWKIAFHWFRSDGSRDTFECELLGNMIGVEQADGALIRLKIKTQEREFVSYYQNSDMGFRCMAGVFRYNMYRRYVKHACWFYVDGSLVHQDEEELDFDRQYDSIYELLDNYFEHCNIRINYGWVVLDNEGQQRF